MLVNITNHSMGWLFHDRMALQIYQAEDNAVLKHKVIDKGLPFDRKEYQSQHFRIVSLSNFLSSTRPVIQLYIVIYTYKKKVFLAFLNTTNYKIEKLSIAASGTFERSLRFVLETTS